MTLPESTPNRPRRRRPVTVKSHIRTREEFIASEVYRTIRGLGISERQADQVTRQAFRRARTLLEEASPDVTKADLESLKIRR